MNFFALRSIPILLLCSFSIVSLSGQDRRFIEGKILITGTNEPVQFATVRLNSNNIGVFANSDGDFRISNKREFLNDSLTITCIGYLKTTLLFRSLSDSSENRIYLTPSLYNLKEVKVTSSRKILGSQEMVRLAIKYMWKNCPRNGFSYTCYYRDYQKKEKQIQNLNEAIIQVLDKGFNELSIFNSSRLLDFRQNTDFPRVSLSPYYNETATFDSSKPWKYIPSAKMGDQFGNEFFVLQVHDAIRNFRARSFSYINTLAADFISNHFFGKPEPVYDNNLLLYRIYFNARSRLTGDSLLATGAIYIQPRDFSIHKLEYTCYYLTDGWKKKEMFNIKTEYDYENSIGSKLYLKYISFNNLFRVADPADTLFFRVTSSFMFPEKVKYNTVVLIFNHRIDPVSAQVKDNYQVYDGTRAMRIKNISVQGKRLILMLKGSKPVKEGELQVYVMNIKDVSGNIVNRRKTAELSQYRELFVQDHNQNISFKDSCYMQYRPLDKNCISHPVNNEKYWMNTPGKITNNK